MFLEGLISQAEIKFTKTSIFFFGCRNIVQPHDYEVFVLLQA